MTVERDEARARSTSMPCGPDRRGHPRELAGPGLDL